MSRLFSKFRVIGCAVLLAATRFSFGQSAINPAPTLPTIGTTIFNVTNSAYGASTDSANNATAINAAITAASKNSGGGIVEIPGPGVYLSGPITLKSKVNLQVDAGATLMMLAYTNWSGTTTFITGSSLTDNEISGSGTIDGQGAAWWSAFNASGISRPNFIQFSSCNRILIRDITLQNPPTFHIMIKNNNANITVTNLTINTPYPSPNTDGFDISSTNVLIENSYISDGDDNVEIGGSSPAAEITITNCTLGNGHGISMGSITSGGVSNILVINSTFTGTDNAIRMKSDVGNGGVVQNLSYYNITMSGIKYAPVLIYSYYTDYGNPTTAGITPTVAAGETVSKVSSTSPVWRNIVISNVTATAGEPGMIWGLLELPATNIVLADCNFTGSGAFDLYNVKGLKIIDSKIHPTSGNTMYELLNAQVTFTNSATGAPSFTIDGITSTNSLAFYNQAVVLNNTNFFGTTPLTVSDTTVDDLNALTLPASTPVNFGLGTAPTTITVHGALAASSTLNISDGGGFGPGTYTLFDYTGSLSSTPVLGTKPAGYNYNLDTTDTPGQVNLIVTSTNTSGIPTITNAPTPQTVYVSSNATFTVGASGTSPLVYQWLFNSTSPVIGATNPVLTLTNVQLTNAGGYSVIVTNNYGMVTSQVAALTVVPLPNPNKLLVTLPGQTYASGSGNSGPVAPQTAGTPFDLTLTAVQSDGVTLDSGYSGTNVITFSGPGGSPNYPAKVVFTNGQAANVPITLTLPQTTTLSAADTANGLNGIPGSSLLVNPGAISGYSVSAGTLQTVGVAFNVTVTAQDVEGNTVTTDNSTGVTLSGMGSATATVNPKTLTAGVAIFSVMDTNAETITITAADGNNQTGVSSSITINTIPSLPVYRSTASGNWNTASTWQSSADGGVTWLAAIAAPELSGSNATAVYITNNADSGTAVTVTNTSAIAVSNVVVCAGDTLATAGATLTVNSIAGLTNLDVFGTVIVAASNASAVTNAGTAGNLSFESGGEFLLETTNKAAIPTAAWNAGSICEYAPLTTGTTIPAGLGQTFGNFVWNWPAQSGSAILGDALTNVQGNIDVTSGSAFCFGPKPDTTATSGTLTVGGSINVHQMGGNFLLGSGGTEAGTYLVQVGKGIILDSNGRLDVGNNGTSHTGSVTVEFTGNSQFTLNGVALGNPEGGAFIVDAGHTLSLNSTVVVGRTFTVNGTVDFNTNQITGYTNTGSLICNGTLVGNGTNQLTTGLSNAIYGGTLNLGALPALVSGQSFGLFDAGAYNTNSAFSSIVPAAPGAGLAWNTSQLVVNGSLAVAGGGSFAISSGVAAGSDFTLGGNAGIGNANGTYSVLASTNMALPVTSWTLVASNQPLDAGGNFSFTVTNAPGSPQEFYLIKVP